ncbi:uncharacterized protein LOC142987698 [Anticarsia gemmatalis]|uniref:uncharacterized protein LOC142987698 n=1 Tax=Anticarsia gemmatalis TaxID=129554 RepID=UPI003F77672A
MYLILIISAFFALTLANATIQYDLNNAAQYFEEFIREFDKHYIDEHEKAARFEIFKSNLHDVNVLNSEVFGITQFSDLTLEEFSSMYNGFGRLNGTFNSKCRVLSDKDIPAVQTPEQFDWTKQNAVTRIKNQGPVCQSCYTFSTTGLLEGQNAIKKKQLVELSEQQILDCDKRSYGCRSGGFMSWSLTSLMELGGIMKGADYPYTAKDGPRCLLNKNKIVVKVNRCSTFRLKSQEKLKQLLVQYGPVSIAIKGDNFQKYKGGVIKDQNCSKGAVNHAVLLVGYGTDPAEGPFWRVKNSYGTKFGESGYFRMVRGERAHSCGAMNEHITIAAIV